MKMRSPEGYKGLMWVISQQVPPFAKQSIEHTIRKVNTCIDNMLKAGHGIDRVNSFYSSIWEVGLGLQDVLSYNISNRLQNNFIIDHFGLVLQAGVDELNPFHYRCQKINNHLANMRIISLFDYSDNIIRQSINSLYDTALSPDPVVPELDRFYTEFGSTYDTDSANKRRRTIDMKIKF